MSRPVVSKPFEIGLAALATLLITGSGARPAAAADNFYQVPIGYTWDHLSYADNPGDWDVAIGDTGFEADAIPGNNGSPANGPAVTVMNNDPARGRTNIPLLVGPTADGQNNVQVMNGQTVPVVPGSYNSLYVTYSAVCGPHSKPLILNYSDGQTVVRANWADWCAANQVPGDFFTWTARHRNSRTGQDNNSCSLITKYVPVNPNRTLVGVTFGFDQRVRPQDVEGVDIPGNTFNGSGEQMPGDVITANCGRTVLGGLTLVSDNAGLGGYGAVRGRILNADGTNFQPGSHEESPTTGVAVAVIKPYLGNYGAAANTDGTYTIGLPPGTYTLSAAVRKGGGEDAASSGFQASPVTVTITAGQTVEQNITLLGDPVESLVGSITGTVQDASGAPAEGQFISISDNENGPFQAHGLSGGGLTTANGAFTLQGLAPGDYFLVAGSNNSRSDPVRVTVTGGGAATAPNITVRALAIGDVVGNVRDPSGNFGGLGNTLQLVSANGQTTLTATTSTFPLQTGTGVIPPEATARFEFSAVPAGQYTLRLLPSVVNASEVTKQVTVTQGQTLDLTAAADSLTIVPPPFIEGTENTARSDDFQGAASNAWTVADVASAERPVTGAGTLGADGRLTTTGGFINDGGAMGDQFTFAYQVIPANEDFAATLDVVAPPTAGDNSRVGIMLREDNNDELAADAFVAVTNNQGVLIQGREAGGAFTFPFGQTAVGTNPAVEGGVQPALPVSIKLRKVGGAVAAFMSTDGGTTQRFIGSFLPTLSTANLRLGVAVTSGVADTEDTAQVRNFRYATLTGGLPAAGNGDIIPNGAVDIADATASLQIGVGNRDAVPANDVNGDGAHDLKDTTIILQIAVGLRPAP